MARVWNENGTRAVEVSIALASSVSQRFRERQDVLLLADDPPAGAASSIERSSTLRCCSSAMT